MHKPLLAKFCAGLIVGVSLIGVAQAQPAVSKRSGEARVHETRVNETDVSLHSTITGNQEQPKVLYIVPWQGPGGADQLNTGLQPIVSDVFAPVDRREFQRELKYREMTIEGPPAAE